MCIYVSIESGNIIHYNIIFSDYLKNALLEYRFNFI